MSKLDAPSAADIKAFAMRHPGAMRSSWSEQAPAFLLAGTAMLAAIAAFLALDISWARVFSGIGELGRIMTLMLPPDYGSIDKLTMWTKALAETLAIAFLGTVLAAILAFPVGLLAARNVVPIWLVRFLLRRSLDTVRGVDTLIWALIWINVVGLGPFAGVLAIMASDFGTFGKLFSEAIEAADRRPVEGVHSVGGNQLEAVRFGIVPQVLPVILSQILYYFESNTRSATIIGIVGAGGIGLHLSEQIRTLEWQHVSVIVLMILATVATIDFISSRLRFVVIGRHSQVES